MRQLNTVKLPVQSQFKAVNKVIFQKCVVLSVSLILFPLLICIFQSRLTDLSFTRTAQTNEANAASAFMSQSRQYTEGQSIATPQLSPTRAPYFCL